MKLLPHEPLPDGAVDRIVAVVAAKLDHVPDDLDRDKLRADLEGIVSLYRTSADLRSKPATRSQDVRKIVETARHLQSLIEDNWLLRPHSRVLEWLIADAESKFSKKLTAMLGVGPVSAFENLVGLMLKRTFELHFGVGAGYTTNPVTDEVSGPFVEFTEAALEEFGITNSHDGSYTRSSIVTALKRVRKV